jgi:ABC-type uncharacterized transport system permease subunit
MALRKDATDGVFEACPITQRAIAIILDGILLSFVAAGVIFMVFGTFNVTITDPTKFLTDTSQLSVADWAATLFFPHVIIFSFWVVFLATPGNLYSRSFITNAHNGRKPGVLRLFIRYVVLMSPYIAWLFGVPYALHAYALCVTSIIDPLKRCPHDLLSRTMVARPLHSGSVPISFR